MKIAASLAARPGGTLPQAFPRWAELKAAYRFFGQSGVSFERVAEAPVLGQSTVEVRARAGQPARTARVAVRSVRVDLDGPWRPGGWQGPLKAVGVVEVSEVPAPEGVKQPLHWILLTSLPCTTWAQAQQGVGR